LRGARIWGSTAWLFRRRYSHQTCRRMCLLPATLSRFIRRSLTRPRAKQRLHAGDFRLNSGLVDKPLPSSRATASSSSSPTRRIDQRRRRNPSGPFLCSTAGLRPIQSLWHRRAPRPLSAPFAIHHVVTMFYARGCIRFGPEPCHLSLHKDVAKDEDGASLLQYTILIGILAVAVLATISMIGGWISKQWAGLNSFLSSK
jgi:pilus assembly protein Flp/PilA